MELRERKQKTAIALIKIEVPPLVRKNKNLMKGGFFMPSGKKMYSTELKLEIAQKYLQGTAGVKKLAEECHVHKGDIQKWRDAYLEHGVEGLHTSPGKYSGDFKISVVEYMHNTESSL